MATVNRVVAAANGGASTLTLRYDDVSHVVSRVSWVNPAGTWTFTLTKAGGVVVSRTLAPGASGGANIQASRDLQWLEGKAEGGNFEIADSWSAT